MVFVACLPMLAKWYRARAGLGEAATGGQMHVISALAVGTGQRLVTVEAGPAHARVVMVLGVTAQTITCLHTAPAGSPAASLPTIPPELR
jgi:flagellar protein FliO/FliZ